MASLGGEQIISLNNNSDTALEKDENNQPNAGKKTPIREREDKLRVARERQNEERQRKIEELKAQAEAAQKYREQKEEERRRRIEELRSRDNDKRQQVEERKRAIMEAEKERREYILRKNMERESRLETRKKNDRSSISFAFGSSTPRLLEPADFGTVSPSVYWGHRRSTSITNVAYTGASITRRSSERELPEGAKKRATSAGGADRRDEDIVDTPQIYRSVARRKTDLMPTIPSPRDSSYFGSKSSLSNTPRTPGRALSMNRLDQLAQPIRRNGEHIRAIIERERAQQLELLHESDEIKFGSKKYRRNGDRKSMSRSMTHLASGTKHHHNVMTTSFGGGDSTLRPLRKMDSFKSMTQLSNRPVTASRKFATRLANKKDDHLLYSVTPTGSRSGDVTPGGTSRPGSAMSNSTIMSTSGYVPRRSTPLASARKPRPASIAGTVVSLEESRQRKELPKTPVSNKVLTTPKRGSLSGSSSTPRVASVERKTPAKKDTTPHKPPTSASKPPISKTRSSEKLRSRNPSSEALTTSVVENVKTKDEKNALNTVKTETTTDIETVEIRQVVTETVKAEETSAAQVETTTVDTEKEQAEEKADNGNEKDTKAENVSVKETTPEVRELSVERQENDMTASMMARKITTEEEAKAALAERRRLAREEAERQAELERQRIEAEHQAELKRQEEEEERQRLFEEESIRMAQEQRRAEEQRLKEAIEEAERREEAERAKREEEERLRIEREEAEKKAKEEAEKLRLEVAERLKREEKEREERRKRVEAIMSRTRKAGSAATPNSTPVKDNGTKADEKQTPADKVPESDVKNSSDSDSSLSHKEQIAPNTSSTATTPSSDSKIVTSPESQSEIVQSNSAQALYEQSVTDKESALMKSFSNLIIDENARNLQNVVVTRSETNGKHLNNDHQNDIVLHNSVANGNGHFESINNIKKDTNILVDVVPSTDQLIDVSNESQQQITHVVNFNNNNNNSLLATTASLVTADSHENKEISLL